MTFTQPTLPAMNRKDLNFFRAMFVLAALWNLAGGILGYFNTAYTFNLLFDRALSDPLYFDVYKGACGTTLVYFIGYLIVARDPVRHVGIVLVGGIGKVGFAVQLLKFHVAGIANANAYVVIVGDLIFSALFLYYGFKMVQLHRSAARTAPSERGMAAARTS